MADPRDVIVDDEAAAAPWHGARGARERVLRLVRWTVDQEERRAAERNRQVAERFRNSWDRTNALFDPDTSLRAMHKRLHLPIGSPDAAEPIPDTPPDPDERDSIPDDYAPSMQPVAGSETAGEEET